jgi:hypothetical protein
MAGDPEAEVLGTPGYLQPHPFEGLRAKNVKGVMLMVRRAHSMSFLVFGFWLEQKNELYKFLVCRV